jgi:hypothetical protein
LRRNGGESVATKAHDVSPRERSHRSSPARCTPQRLRDPPHTPGRATRSSSHENKPVREGGLRVVVAANSFARGGLGPDPKPGIRGSGIGDRCRAQVHLVVQARSFRPATDVPRAGAVRLGLRMAGSSASSPTVRGRASTKPNYRTSFPRRGMARTLPNTRGLTLRAASRNLLQTHDMTRRQPSSRQRRKSSGIRTRRRGRRNAGD